MSDATEPGFEAQPDRPVHPRPSADEALKLSRAFYRIKNPDSRAAIIAFAERLADES